MVTETLNPATDTLVAVTSDLELNGRRFQVFWAANRPLPREASDILPDYETLKAALPLVPFSDIHREIDAATAVGNELLTASEAEAVQELLVEQFGDTFPITTCEVTPVIGRSVPARGLPGAWIGIRLPGSAERVGVPIEGILWGISSQEMPGNAHPTPLYAVAALLEDPTTQSPVPVLLTADRAEPVVDWREVASIGDLVFGDPEQAQAHANQWFTLAEAEAVRDALVRAGYTEVWVEQLPEPLNFQGATIGEMEIGDFLGHTTLPFTGLPEHLRGIRCTAYLGGPEGDGVTTEQRAEFRAWLERLAAGSSRYSTLPLMAAISEYAQQIGEPGRSALEHALATC